MQIKLANLGKSIKGDTVKNKIFKTRTDLITDDSSNNVKKEEYTLHDIKVTKSIYKGNYYSLSFNDLSNVVERKNLIKALTLSIKEIMKLNNITKKMSCLVVGLGNINSTPDALGPKSLFNIIVTKYLFLNNLITVDDKYRDVSSFTPSVTGITGLSTLPLIKSVIKEFKPNFVIAIDSLASSKIERVLHVIQVTDTGIHPGSGVGNNCGEISKKTVGVPVIAIGVPTVIDAATIVSDTIKYLYQKISYTKENINSSKLTYLSNNHMNKPEKLDNVEKEKLLGLIGTLTENDLKNLFNEVLVDENLIVTPKEIDFDIEKLSTIISTSINNSCHDLDSTNN